jgi:dTDP-4-dehydrorhamnose 3,5-epimerase
MPFEIKKLGISEVLLIKTKVFKDDRGFFAETYKSSDFAKFDITDTFIQDHLSASQKGVIRGLHYQKNPKAQAKLVTCTKGKILDVALDMRKSSPTFGKWTSHILEDKNMESIYIPTGFAHGFAVIGDYAEVFYKVTNEYSPEHESGIIYNDPKIAIDWGIKNPILSARDTKWPTLDNADNNF